MRISRDTRNHLCRTATQQNRPRLQLSLSLIPTLSTIYLSPPCNAFKRLVQRKLNCDVAYSEQTWQ